MRPAFGIMELLVILVVVALAVGIAVIVVAFAMRKKQGGDGLNGAMGPTPPMGAPPAPLAPVDPATLPSQWGWCWLDQPGRPRVLGFNYVDKTAGASFRVVVDNAAGLDAASVAQQASAAEYRGDTIVRLNGHEWISGTFAAMLPSEPVTRQQVVSLTPEELQNLSLPGAPLWVGAYL